jgi:hypothetical protein
MYICSGGGNKTCVYKVACFCWVIDTYMQTRSSLTCEFIVWASGRRKEQAKVGRHCLCLGFSDAVYLFLVLCVRKCGEVSDKSVTSVCLKKVDRDVNPTRFISSCKSFYKKHRREGLYITFDYWFYEPLNIRYPKRFPEQLNYYADRMSRCSVCVNCHCYSVRNADR